MIGIAQDNLCLDLLPELFEVHTFYRSARSHRHKDGRLDLSMRRSNDTGTGIAGTVCMLQFECHTFSFSFFSVSISNFMG